MAMCVSQPASKSTGSFLSKSSPVESAPKPVNRRDVLIKCPVSKCGKHVLRWTCSKCQEVLEYGLDNGHLYCNCGMIEVFDCEMKCDKHKMQAVSKEQLQAALAELKPYEEINLLIMGETGVGKSTFINAFANYLTYPTVEEALEGNIITLVPNRFYMSDEDLEEVCIQNGEVTEEDKNNLSPRQSAVTVPVNTTADEIFEPGQSGTQKTKVHRFLFGETVLRIIDTPGIGDVRGALQDNENFKNILDTIASLPSLHGIIILLKPNQAKLTITFRYCIEELLTHLHKSAMDNIVFGFTNSRSTNFRPRDTLPALRRLLAKQSVGIQLSNDNVYCFDSESYRFLTALQHGLNFDDDLVDSFSKSWRYSVKETARLISYIQTLNPHMTRETLREQRPHPHPAAH